jgi:hypothetical protein
MDVDNPAPPRITCDGVHTRGWSDAIIRCLLGDLPSDGTSLLPHALETERRLQKHRARRARSPDLPQCPMRHFSSPALLPAAEIVDEITPQFV